MGCGPLVTAPALAHNDRIGSSMTTVAWPDRRADIVGALGILATLEPPTAVLDELGPAASDDDYLTHPRWHEVTHAATGTHHLMTGETPPWLTVAAATMILTADTLHGEREPGEPDVDTPNERDPARPVAGRPQSSPTGHAGRTPRGG